MPRSTQPSVVAHAVQDRTQLGSPFPRMTITGYATARTR
jgi:hypothetical protein